jgi:hypothetical protein
MIKTMVSIVTGQSRYKTINRYSLDDYQQGWQQTKDALRFAYNFIKSNARIDNLRLLSSSFLLIPIAYYALLKGEKLNDEEVNKLLLWFYVSHMKGRYSKGSSESILDSDINILKNGGSLSDLLEHLKLQVRDFYVTEAELKYKNRRSPYFTLLFLIAKQKGVKDWFTGIGITEKMTGRTHAVQFHHIMPKSHLRNLGHDIKSINDLSNLTFIGGKTNRNISNKLPSEYLNEILKKRGEVIFKDNYIPSDTTLWDLAEFESFLNYRRSVIVKEINEFIEAHMK